MNKDQKRAIAFILFALGLALWSFCFSGCEAGYDSSGKWNTGFRKMQDAELMIHWLAFFWGILLIAFGFVVFEDKR